MGIAELVELRLDRRDHPGLAMAEAGDRGAARAVDDRVAVAVVQIDPLAADGDRRILPQAAVDEVAHGSSGSGR